MSENPNLGAAGPALAAHSKDGSVPGPTPASSNTGDQGDAKDQVTAGLWQGYRPSAGFRDGEPCWFAAGRGKRGTRLREKI
jgi:hypothetical protein